MEIINKNPKYPSERGRNVFIGLVLIAAGVVWLLYNTGVVDARFFDIIFSWQMLLVVIGGYLLCLRNWVAGGVVAGVGLVFLAGDMLDWQISFSKVVLPVLLIVAGASVLFYRRK